MENFTLKERVLGSMFQSVTTRTAGFNTTDTAHMSKASVFISLILMFIGASPGSTGGGIKTTSFAVIILSVVAILSSNRDVIVFRRRLSDILVRRVMALIAISIMLIFIIIFLLMIIEPFSFEHIAFEVISAFGTVGLSMGITPYLSETGRILITILMYFGRIGPLTFIFALSRKKMQTDYQFSEEKISVG
jgi:trk system potassium uptake protein TrkH